MERIPKPGECYRHFKNKLYQVITVAHHTETGEALVIYQALYGTFRTYARPLSMFAGQVDHEKYPEAKQNYRFLRIDLEELAEEEYAERNSEEDAERSSGENAARNGGEDAERSSGETAEGCSGEKGEKDSERSRKDIEEASESVSCKILLDFLESKTYDEKLEVLEENRGRLSKRELEAICHSLDIVTGTGQESDMLKAAMDFLQIQARYNGKRLR